MSGDPEQLQNEQERIVETQQSAAEQLEKLKDNPEASVELSPRDLEAQAERLRIEALETAVSIEKGGKEVKKSGKHSIPSQRGSINKKQREKSYIKTMERVQSELPMGSRLFSKVIHNKFIEKTSDVLGDTITRPNAMLSGTVVAFILTLLTYTIAKTVGYALSGFETIAAFIVGWVLGIVYDYLRVLFTGTKS